MRIVYCLYTLILFCIFSSTSFADALDPFKLSYYQVLNVPENATIEQIRAARQAIVSQYVDAKTPEGRAWVIAANRAFDGLGDPESRTAYDFKVSVPPVSSTGGDHYHADNMLREIIEFMSPKKGPLTNQLLVELQTLLLKRMGNPQFMIHPRQRSVFYNDVAKLIKAVDAQNVPAFASRPTLIVTLDLLIKYQDPIGLELLDSLYLKWEERIRRAYPGNNTFHLQERIHFVEVLEGKYKRYVPKPHLQQQICVGHLIDQHA